MERFPRGLEDAVKLIQLSELLKNSAMTVIEEWSKESFHSKEPHGSQDNARILPSHRLHEAQRTILSLAGALTELVAEPPNRIQEVSSQYWESRALYVAAERRIPDLLAAAGEEGLDIKAIAEATGIEHLKLSVDYIRLSYGLFTFAPYVFQVKELTHGPARLLRCLCSIHVFKQVGPDRFANNRISAALVKNEHLRAYVLLFNLDMYTTADRYPKYLLGPKGASYDVREAAFQEAMGTDKSRWDWAAELVPPSQVSRDKVGYPGVPDPKNWNLKPRDASGNVSRPELENFGLAMIGGGKVSGAAHPYDYPWGELGGALMVDVGGGVGGFVLQLLKPYPNLKFVVQDRAEVLQQAVESVWPEQAPEALRNGRVSFMEHDFFMPNPVKGADVYWLRYILHDWSDDYCVRILSAIRDSMGPNSRILICDQVMNTTYGCSEIASAPAPLPANYGYYTRYCHNRDLGLGAVLNGIERTPSQFDEIIRRAGLRLEKLWECRSMVGIVEARLP